jgi:hypothetical protein
MLTSAISVSRSAECRVQKSSARGCAASAGVKRSQRHPDRDPPDRKIPDAGTGAFSAKRESDAGADPDRISGRHHRDTTRHESFDVPKGALRGAPPVPEDDPTTLRVSFYLVANKKLDSDLIASFTQAFLSARRDLVGELPILDAPILE